jgi:hypothetical protein
MSLRNDLFRKNERITERTWRIEYAWMGGDTKKSTENDCRNGKRLIAFDKGSHEFKKGFVSGRIAPKSAD